MNIQLECIPCLFKQAIDAAKLANTTKKQQKKIINNLCKIVLNLDMKKPPPVIGRKLYRLVEKISRNTDPFKEIKKEANILSLQLYPKLKQLINTSKEPLLTALELSLYGNTIDHGAKNSLDTLDIKIKNQIFNLEIKKLLNGEFIHQNKAVFEYEEFKKAIDKAKTALYITDNAGEIVFDKILMETLKKDKDITIICALRDKPIINDATIEDAKFCGLDEVAQLISSGCDAPGILLNNSSKKFIEIYEKVDIIISKGQGNFETLSEIKEEKRLFFLFKVKCSVVANYLNCKVGDVILKRK